MAREYWVPRSGSDNFETNILPATKCIIDDDLYLEGERSTLNYAAVYVKIENCTEYEAIENCASEEVT